VIPVHHAGEESGQLYLAMRLVDGVDLRSLVEASGPLDPAHAIRVLAGIAAGLDAAHARGLVHRDVKPANVLIERDGDAERVFLTDFGISRLAGSGESLTTTGQFFGSVDFVAPEQIEGEPLDRRTDVYALGGVLHFVLTAQPPLPLGIPVDEERRPSALGLDPRLELARCLRWNRAQ
jgi:serine/threonine protein kinase